MKIYYITNLRFPTEKAHGVQIAKMCDAFLALGHSLTLVIPDRRTHITQTVKEYYQLRQDVPTIRLHIFDALSFKWIPRWIAFVMGEISFYRAVRSWMKTVRQESAFVITRDQFLAPHLCRSDWKLAFEAHDVSPRFFFLHRSIARTADVIVATNEWKKSEIIKQWGTMMRGKVIALQNGIDLATYEHMSSKQEARNKLCWKQDECIVLYSGHLYDWKGVFVLADASALLHDDMRVVMLGGTVEDANVMRDYLRKHNLSRVSLVAHVPPKDVLTYLAAADVFVLPNSAKSWNSLYTTSPIKLWEYLAARRPLVASDLPSLREAVTDAEVLFVKPDDPKALAEGIVVACQNSENRVEKGWQRVKMQTWERRAQAIIDAML